MKYVIIYLNLQMIPRFSLKLILNDNHTKLRADLKNLYNWSEDSQLLFNLDKCKIMHFGYNNPNNIFLLGSHILETVNEERDFGVMIRKDLKLSSQYIKVAKIENHVLGIIKRTIAIKTKENLFQLYKSLVRPYFEYYTQVWSPCLKKDIDLLKEIQRRTRKMTLRYKHH